MLYVFFWVIPRRLNFIYRRFGTLFSIFMGRYSVPKRRHIKFRRRGITQKTTYNKQLSNYVWTLCALMQFVDGAELNLRGQKSKIISGHLNPLNAELNPICHLLALLGVHHFLHISRIRVKSITLRLLMSYIYIYIWSAYS